jgi:hypothetical protein
VPEVRNEPAAERQLLPAVRSEARELGRKILFHRGER